MNDSTIPPIKYKRCSQGDNCIHPEGPSLPRTAEYFYMSGDHASARCRECQKVYRREHHARNREYDNARSLAYVEANRERVYAKAAEYRDRNHEKINAYYREKYRRNRKQESAKKLAQYHANRDKYREAHRRWRQENPEQARIRINRYRARKRNAPGSHTAEEIRLIYEQQKGRCYWCQCKLRGNNWHVDHRIPLVKGGSNDASNLVIACPACNQSKGGKLPHEWCGRLL